MSLKNIGLLVLILPFMFGCAVHVPTVQVAYTADKTPKDVVENVAVVLLDYGFVPCVISPELGLVVTEWWTATTPGEEAMTRVLTSLGRYPQPSSGRQRIKLSIVVNKQTHKLLIKPIKQSHSGTAINLDEGDEQMLQRLALDIVGKLGGTTFDIEWNYPIQKEEEVMEPPSKEDGIKIITIALAVSFLLILTVNKPIR